MGKVKTYKDKDGYQVFKSGKKIPAWFLYSLPVLVFIPILLKATWSRLHKRACALTMLLFYPQMAFVEHKAIMNLWWNYNIQKDFFSFKGIPITEWTIYYIYPIVFNIALYEWLCAKIKKLRDWQIVAALWIINIPMTILFEWLGVDVSQIWGFDTMYEGLWGITLLSYPIEEFVFWWGAPLYVIATYRFFKRR